MTPTPATKKYLGTKVLVTGADGFIGSHLVEALVLAGAEITALAQYNSFDSHGWLDDLPEPVRRQVHVVRGDVRDAAFVGRLVPAHEIVFHLAALIAIPHSYAAPQSYVETNVLGTLHVLEAARQHGTERIVHTSTSEVYGTALKMPIDESHPLQGQSPYSASKIAADMMAEAYARSFGVPVVILRPFNTFGPRQSERAIIASIIRQALDPSCPAIMVGDATTVRDLTFVTDTAAAFMAAGSADGIEFGQAYNAGSGRAIVIADLIDLIVDLSSSEKPVLQDEKRLRPANSEVRALLADCTSFVKTTGWSPQVPMRRGLERTVDWWRGRLSASKVRRQRDFIT
ncbi:SDR family NAD(P)-dependent oxidoreductase [Bradyrhizobium sp. sBnM-33]|uniref:SDR family NAD(P)-dependent oxidoreductase n=1 Tax=Bradyrhizobium sp. sBnM-33 TaxID=2831780 RepID=UPI001BCF3EDB|nr:SDR family NAD(P)-dependent oxidoreductase [Bradyrhizobium sp. sBnM-33]WOH46951.1 SDR family NAD(P)-dependent oxidoreductase [Bradyrhizobium sp. sBnM-33]